MYQNSQYTRGGKENQVNMSDAFKMLSKLCREGLIRLEKT